MRTFCPSVTPGDDLDGVGRLEPDLDLGARRLVARHDVDGRVVFALAASAEGGTTSTPCCSARPIRALRRTCRPSARARRSSRAAARAPRWSAGSTAGAIAITSPRSGGRARRRSTSSACCPTLTRPRRYRPATWAASSTRSTFATSTSRLRGGAVHLLADADEALDDLPGDRGGDVGARELAVGGRESGLGLLEGRLGRRGLRARVLDLLARGDAALEEPLGAGEVEPRVLEPAPAPARAPPSPGAAGPRAARARSPPRPRRRARCRLRPRAWRPRGRPPARRASRPRSAAL